MSSDVFIKKIKLQQSLIDTYLSYYISLPDLVFKTKCNMFVQSVLNRFFPVFMLNPLSSPLKLRDIVYTYILTYIAICISLEE